MIENMQWKVIVIVADLFAGVACLIVSLNAEDDQEELSVQVEYDGKKLEIVTPKSAGITLFEHWTRHAMGAFIAAYAFQKSLRLNYFRRNEYASCVREANTTKRIAECAENIIANTKLKMPIGEN
uniref:Uncharacterized protein n=1 Tax=Parascaris equorum TaxID=6256 RepID=A0A914SAN3_PAREQ